MSQQTILIVDDEKHTREGLAASLEGKYEIFLARDAEEAFGLLDAEKFDLVLTDLRMAGKSGLSVIDKTISLPSRPVCIMMTAYGNVETAVEAMRRGAHDFLQKPINLERLEHIIKTALNTRKTVEENTEPPPPPPRTAARPAPAASAFNPGNVIGDSPAFVRVLAQVRQVARSRATVLLLGETGTGKELFAQMTHRNSPRAGAPFVAVHCAALPANLLESELFGHEKGSFTGATERRIGRFEAAAGGTLFLDEIGEIDALTQVKLLRFLETRTFERIGSNKPIQVDVRLVCATNKDLLSEVAKGTFREDLFYRISVVQIHLPPLRERPEDIPVLVKYYLEHFARENSLTPPTLTAPALSRLATRQWPGNIRELRNFCENIVVMHAGKTLGEYDLAFNPPPATAPVQPDRNSLSRTDNEKRLLRQALVEASGNRTKAAILLGLSRRTLLRKLEKWPELDVFPPPPRSLNSRIEIQTPIHTSPKPLTPPPPTLIP
ncbi:MAG: sigma-54 dependent transcriptional regulator [Puniceicoccales bacterium]|jgi:DNA-binding NtrC family response regulator|nr:sigma-54 dependent transcriptional regulator [Puniceicoccales bacterium]